MLEKIEIPIIEKADGGFWEIYPDKKIWHQENNIKPMSSLDELYQEEKANKKSMFVSLADGESFEGEFVSVEKTTGQFGEVNSFHFLIDGEEKLLNSKSFKLLKNMIGAKVKEGDKVKITKTGQGFKTNFTVEKLSK